MKNQKIKEKILVILVILSLFLVGVTVWLDLKPDEKVIKKENINGY